MTNKSVMTFISVNKISVCLSVWYSPWLISDAANTRRVRWGGCQLKSGNHCCEILHVMLTLVLPEPYICVFEQISDQINSTQVVKLFYGRCLVNLIITFRRRIFLHKYNYVSSFGAGNCVSNSSFKWMKNSPKQLGSIRVKRIMQIQWWVTVPCKVKRQYLPAQQVPIYYVLGLQSGTIETSSCPTSLHSFLDLWSRSARGIGPGLA